MPISGHQESEAGKQEGAPWAPRGSLPYRLIIGSRRPLFGNHRHLRRSAPAGGRLASEQVAEIAGIRMVRHTTCGKPGCRCQGDPPHRHGPYYQWSRAVAGKTVSRRLNEREAEIYRGWIANRRRLEEIVAEMERISAAAGELLLRQASPPGPPRPRTR